MAYEETPAEAAASTKTETPQQEEPPAPDADLADEETSTEAEAEAGKIATGLRTDSQIDATKRETESESDQQEAQAQAGLLLPTTIALPAPPEFKLLAPPESRSAKEDTSQEPQLIHGKSLLVDEQEFTEELSAPPAEVHHTIEASSADAATDLSEPPAPDDQSEATAEKSEPATGKEDDRSEAAEAIPALETDEIDIATEKDEPEELDLAEETGAVEKSSLPEQEPELPESAQSSDARPEPAEPEIQEPADETDDGDVQALSAESDAVAVASDTAEASKITSESEAEVRVGEPPFDLDEPEAHSLPEPEEKGQEAKSRPDFPAGEDKKEQEADSEPASPRGEDVLSPELPSAFDFLGADEETPEVAVPEADDHEPGAFTQPEHPSEASQDETTAPPAETPTATEETSDSERQPEDALPEDADKSEATQEDEKATSGETRVQDEIEAHDENIMTTFAEVAADVQADDAEQEAESEDIETESKESAEKTEHGFYDSEVDELLGAHEPETDFAEESRDDYIDDAQVQETDSDTEPESGLDDDNISTDFDKGLSEEPQPESEALPWFDKDTESLLFDQEIAWPEDEQHPSSSSDAGPPDEIEISPELFGAEESDEQQEQNDAPLPPFEQEAEPIAPDRAEEPDEKTEMPPAFAAQEHLDEIETSPAFEIIERPDEPEADFRPAEQVDTDSATDLSDAAETQIDSDVPATEEPATDIEISPAFTIEEREELTETPTPTTPVAEPDADANEPTQQSDIASDSEQGQPSQRDYADIEFSAAFTTPAEEATKPAEPSESERAFENIETSEFSRRDDEFVISPRDEMDESAADQPSAEIAADKEQEPPAHGETPAKQPVSRLLRIYQISSDELDDKFASVTFRHAHPDRDDTETTQEPISKTAPVGAADTEPQELTPTADLDSATSLPAEPADAPLLRGIRHYRNREYEDAIICFKAVLRRSPDFADGYAMLGNAYFRNQMYSEALTAYEQLDPDATPDPAVHENLGLIYWKLGKKQNALQAWRHVLQSHPERTDLARRVHMVEKYLRKQGSDRKQEFGFENGKADADNEITADRGARVVFDGDPQAHRLVQAGIERYRAGDFEAAIQTFRNLIQSFPDKKQAYTFLGNAYFRNGMFSEAAEIYQRLLSLDESSTTVRENLGFIYFKRGAYDRALAEWGAILEEHPQRTDLQRKIENLRRLQSSNRA